MLTQFGGGDESFAVSVCTAQRGPFVQHVGSGIGRLGHNGYIEEFGIRVERVDLAPVRKDLLHIEAQVIAVITPCRGLVAADGANVVGDRATHGDEQGLAVRDFADGSCGLRLAFVDAQDEFHTMHVVIVPGEDRLADPLGGILVYMLQEDIGIVDEVLMGMLEVFFRESIAVVVAAVVFFGGHTNHPEVRVAGVLGDGVPKFLDFGGCCLGR